MASRGWCCAAAWRERANEVAPTIVGDLKDMAGLILGPPALSRLGLPWVLMVMLLRMIRQTGILLECHA